ncbi:MAG: HEAT repeat domain-containing protein [Armatimonadota bacterium]|nr:HEAT repeat domain-containing protein [Armatimonadota bacterium]
MSRICVWLLLLLLLPSPLLAKRGQQTMTAYIQEAAVIALVDTQAQGYDTQITLREILKGDSALVGQTWICHLARSSESVSVPKGAKGILVLLGQDWRKPDNDAVIEAYQAPADIALLRALIAVNDLPTERERVLALRAHISDPDPRWQEELFYALGSLHERINYALLPKTYPLLDSKGQQKVIHLIGEIGDLRGLPTVLQATHSTDRSVCYEAFWALRFQFPGAPGTLDAFRAALADPEASYSDADTVLRYAPHDAQARAIVEKRRTPYLRAENLREAGKLEESRRLYQQVIENPKEDDFVRRLSALVVLPTADAAFKNRLRPYLLPLLRREAATDDYIQAGETADLLRAFNHPDCLDPLIALLSRTPWTFAMTDKKAAMAVLNLGPSAYRQAAAHLLQILRELPAAPPEYQLDANDERVFVMELAWLGDEAAYQSAKDFLPPRLLDAWTEFHPLVAAKTQSDEGAYLLSLLKNEKTPSDVRDWAAFRLGDRRDPRAIPPLIALLASPSLGYETERVVQDALEEIGGPRVEQALLGLLTPGHSDDARHQALQILSSLQGARILSLLRRLLPQNDALRSDVLLLLSRYGTPDDLAALIPLADFWTGDRANHYWAMTAVAEIRDRCRWDIHGPIRTE